MSDFIEDEEIEELGNLILSERILLHGCCWLATQQLWKMLLLRGSNVWFSNKIFIKMKLNILMTPDFTYHNTYIYYLPLHIGCIK